MELGMFMSGEELKPNIEPVKPICRCCLTTERPMKNARLYDSYFRDLAGISVTDSDGLPQWLCLECCLLLQKAVRFKHKLLRAHTMLYEYLTRCAPFPIDAQDSELSEYSTPHLSASSTQVFDNEKTKTGFHRVLQHKKQVQKSDLEDIELPAVTKEENDNIKDEMGFSDYEDNITLEEYRSNVTKLPEEIPKITEDDLESLLQVRGQIPVKEEDKEIKKKRKTKKKSREDKVKKKESSHDNSVVDFGPADEPDTTEEPKTTLRKQIELDPTKIKIVILNPEQQVKQREEESKANLKFPFQCQLCFKGFNFEAKLQNHMSKHSPSRGAFECKLCQMYLPTSYSHSVHMLIHTRRYECRQCGRRMIDRASILDHYRSQHEGVLTVFTCHLCGKLSSNSKTHRGHMRNHHSGDRPKCDQCGKSFVNKDSLAEHMQIHQGIKNYACGECGKRFRTRTQIKHHQLKHTDVKQFYCVECDVRFKSSHSLRQHLRKSLKHQDKQSFKYRCERCEKRYDSERALEHHVLIQHEGVRPHSCAHCAATLATRNSLNKHMLCVHNGMRPPKRHVCDVCGKAFRGKSVLVNHVRTHTGEKPFACGECGRQFTQRTAMRTHVRLVHLKIPRSQKIKPEAPVEVPEPPKMDNIFAKEEPPLVFDSWARPPMQACDVYFHISTQQ